MNRKAQNEPNAGRRDKQPNTADEHMENQAGATKATEDNDLSTGHSHEGDGGDDNSKQKRS